MKSNSIILIVLTVANFVSIRAENIDIDTVSNETTVVSYLLQFPYPINETQFPESDFSYRENAIMLLVQKDFMRDNTNALMCVADYIGLGIPLSVENKNTDLQNAIRHDRFVEFGDSNYVVRAGIIKFGPTARSCREQYMCRNRYNDHLGQFRISTFRLIKGELMRSRWDIYSEEERWNLLKEFYRRAHATESELEKVR